MAASPHCRIMQTIQRTWSPMARAVRQLSPVSSTQCMFI